MASTKKKDWGLRGLVSLVTGGSKGIGRAVAEAFACEGMHVIVVARGEKALEETRQEILRLGGGVTAVRADVSDTHDLEDLVRKAHRVRGRIDVLVNNASLLGSRVPIVEYPEKEWEDVMRTNLFATFFLTKMILPEMIRQKQGSVINVSSGVGKVGKPRWGAYAVSKFGIEGFTQVLAAEMEGSGIRVNAVNPGPTRTEMRALAYPQENPESLPEPKQIVPVFLYLASNESQGLNGQSLEARDWMDPR
jgi:NAD(P)-dependent dehydrogenase (short-subunit alcohol dehydrogenase family)